MGEIKRILNPLYQGVIHVFKPPLTIKYPYQKPQNIPEENFRYDPKLGVALPGYKGRHILYLDKCTGCNLCDIACLNIAEAITMVYGFNVFLTFDKSFHDAIKKSDPDALSLINSFAGSVQTDIKQTSRDKQGSSLFADPFQIDTKLLAEKEGRLELKLNLDPIYRDRALSVYEEKIEGTVQKLLSGGWQLSQTEVKDGDRDSEYYSLTKKNLSASLGIVKIDEDMAHNKKSIFPMVDYGRCLPLNTLIIAYDGIKPLSEVKVGDRVLAHTGKFRQVTKVFRRSYGGALYTFRSLGNAELLTVTEEHPIMVHRNGQVAWVMPEEISYRDYLVRPLIQWTNDLGSISYDYEQYHPQGTGGYFTIASNVLQCTPSLMRLIGYYLAEGHADRYRVSFDFANSEISLLNDVKNLSWRIFKENVSVKPDKRSKGVKIVIDSVRVASFFRQFGVFCDSKHLPSWALYLPKMKTVNLLKGLWFGDGHYSNKQYDYMHSNYFTLRTTSRILANQLLYLLGRLHIAASLCTQDQLDRKRCYSVTVHTPYIEKMGNILGIGAKDHGPHSHSYIKLLPEREIVISPVTEIAKSHVSSFEVGNLEVEVDNSYVASNQVVHNCVFCAFCIDPSTPVLTNPGMKAMNEIQVGDLVLTHTGYYKPVTKVWDLLYSGPLYEIRVFGHPDPLICTEDHPILALKRPLSNRKDRRLLRVTEPLVFTLPSELKAGDYLVAPIVKIVLNIREYRQTAQLYKNGSVTKEIVFPTDPDLFRLIGYYLSEGFCDGGRRVSFAFGSQERNLIEDCKALLKKYFLKDAKEEKNTGKGTRVRVDSALAERFFKQFGQGPEFKKLTDWVFFAPPAKQAQLIKGLWLSDGCKISQQRQEYLNVKTTSKTLASQVQAVLARLGVVGLIERQDRPDRLTAYSVNVFGRYAAKLAETCGINFVYARTKSANKFHITEEFVFYPIKNISVKEVSNYRVMDVTVAEDHTFVPSGIVTSNCVDACPFYALEMTGEYELSAYSRESLLYDPKMLAQPHLKHERRL